jgi:DNA invertase Pin-like site-specific DNA recombinase
LYRKEEPVATAHTYLAFSTPGQEDGDSDRRQDTLFDGWAKRHPGVHMAKPMEERGTSRYTGDHREEGHPLHDFMKRIEAGHVPRGDYFLVESLDRLTRENPWESIPLLCQIVNAGVTVVSLSPTEMEYKRGKDLAPLLLAVVDLNRSHTESAMKAERLAAVWAQKKKGARENGKPIGKKHPAWIELVDGKYRLKADAAKAVRLIFRWSAEGDGTLAIKQRLDAEGVEPISYGGEWSRGYIGLILNNRSVLGEYQPMDRRKREGQRKGKRMPDGDPIPGYYPAVITEAEWYAAHAAMESRKGRSGRRGEKPFVFSGLLRCALDDCTMHIVVKKGVRYIVSRYAAEHRPGAHFRSFPADVFTEEIRRELRELEASDIFTDPGSSKVAELKGQLMEAERHLTAADANWEANPESKHWQRKVTEYEKKQQKLVVDLEEARRNAESSQPEVWAEKLAVLTKKDPVRQNAALRDIVDHVRVLIVPRGLNRLLYCQVFFKGTDERRAYLLTYYPRDGGRVETTSQLWSEVGAMPDLRKPASVKAVEKLLQTI